MAMLVGLAVLGVLLAATGLFALVAHSVDQRAREIAVRLAVGAGPGTVLRMVLWQGGRFVVAGLAAGVVLSLAVTNRMSSLLFQVPARDVFTFVAAVGLLGRPPSSRATWLPGGSSGWTRRCDARAVIEGILDY